MMAKLCLVHLFSVIMLVTSNPLSQLVQPCNICPPSAYSNPTSIPVVIQQPINPKNYPQEATVQVPSTYSVPCGDNLNQIIMNKILTNPSLHKIMDPNTKLYNQNGEVVQRQASGTGVPNVINNYFIVPPEFFNHNETVIKNEGVEINTVPNDKKVFKRPPKRKTKRRLLKIATKSDDDGDQETTESRKLHGKKRKQKTSANIKTKHIANDNESADEFNQTDDTSLKRHSKRKHRVRQKNKENESLCFKESDEDNLQYQEDLSNAVRIKKTKEIQTGSRKSKQKSKNIIAEAESNQAEGILSLTDIENRNMPEETRKDTYDELDNKTRQKKITKANTRKDDSDKVLKDIEIPSDVSERNLSEKRKTRGSKRNAAKQEPEQHIANIAKNKPLQKITPFSDNILNDFFPYMPSGSFYHPNSNHPYNFDQYYKYLNPVRNSNANRNKRRRKNQNSKKPEANSNTHNIEVKFKPKKIELATEMPVTTEIPNDKDEVVSAELEQSSEIFEPVTDIPMEMPHKVSPISSVDTESSSRESYETFSKLEDLHEMFTPQGAEAEVPSMECNGIINDYYPVFHGDVYYSPYVEKVKNLEDDRYFYETSEDNMIKEKSKFDKYQDDTSAKRDTRSRILTNPDFETENIFNHNGYSNNIAPHSDAEYSKQETVKSSDEVIRVKIPPRNTRVKAENVETVFAGSKVAKYGVSLDGSAEKSVASISKRSSDGSSYPKSGHTKYVVAKSLGPPEDYW